MYALTEEGRRYMEKGLPEKNLMGILRQKTPIQDARKGMENFDIALMWAKSRGWIRVDSGSIIIVKKPAAFPEQDALKKIHEGKEIGKSLLETLIKRNLVREEKEDVYRAVEKQIGSEITSLTPELIKTGLWKKAKLKPYNVELVGSKTFPGKAHVLSHYIEKIRNIFFDLGFQEASGPLVESSFWNFDALYQPQDHPARELADTFYMNPPKEAKLPQKTITGNVKGVHETGGSTASAGWGYTWSEAIARQPVLRTHTTAVSARSLLKLKPPAKIFCIGRVFRNETIDYKHLPEFTQVEGIVCGEGLTFHNLLGYLKEFYSRLGFAKIRFRPSYFPYTEMSVEPEVYFEDRKEWLEMGGAGIFRPEVTKPLGIDIPVLAWGLSLERPIMLKLGLDDMRALYWNDLAFLREKPWP